MKYNEVKEFIEILPESPLVEYSTNIGIDPKNLSTEPVVISLNIEADFSCMKKVPYSRCFLEMFEEGNNEFYKVSSNFNFEPSDEEQDELAFEVFRLMKGFAGERMMEE